MHRFFINSDAIDENGARITGSDVHHIRDVLRLEVDSKIILLDESATEYEAVVSEMAADMIVAKIVSSRLPDQPTVKLALFQGLPKGRKFDTVVEKATELGVDIITPVLTERCVARPDSPTDARLKRWRRIAEAAAKQSRRPTIPEVNELIDWSDLAEKLKSFDRVIFFWEAATTPIDEGLLKFDGDSLALIIGPEGGLAAREAESLLSIGAKPAWLGPRILRTETAPVVAVAIVNHILGR